MKNLLKRTKTQLENKKHFGAKKLRFTYFFVVLCAFVLCVSGTMFSFGENFLAEKAAMAQSVADQQTSAEFENFKNSLQDMYSFEKQLAESSVAASAENDAITENGTGADNDASQANEGGIAKTALLQQGLDKPLQQNSSLHANRLIVSYDGAVQDFGAVAKAEYSDWHVFQYQNAQDADTAFENLKNSNFKVEYDQKVLLQDRDADVTYTQTQPFVADQVIFDGQQASTSKQRTILQTLSTSTEAIYSHHSWGAKYVGYAEYSSTLLQMNDFNVDNLNKIVVAVIDTGIYRTHELFEGRLLEEPYAQNFSNEFKQASSGEIYYDYRDYNGHGTHVAGTIAEATLSNVKILPLKSMDENGEGYVSSIVNAIEYAIILKTRNVDSVDIRALNMSLGVSYDGTGTAQNSSMTKAVNKAYEFGIITVASAGNDAVDVSNSSPANIENAFAISGLQQNSTLSDAPVTFAYRYSNYGEGIDFCAPASDVESAFIPKFDNGYAQSPYATYSGTSMASPHVTAAIALLLSDPNYANATPDEVYNILKEQAQKYADYGAAGKDVFYGWGCVNIGNLGVPRLGEIAFEEQKSGQNTYVKLSYKAKSDANATGENVGAGETAVDVENQRVEIFYTDNQRALTVDEFTGLLYNDTQKILLSHTSKITACAFVYNNAGKLIGKSFLSSQIFYVDNMDISSNYQFAYRRNSNLVYLYGYVGQLKTVKVPSSVVVIEENGPVERDVYAIGYQAFAGTNVENVILSEKVTNLDDSCFKNNQKLKSISGGSETGLAVGGYAFYNCKNLSNFDVKKVVSVGNYAFAYDENLTGRLDLRGVSSVGRQAFALSGIDEVLFGNFEDLEIGTQSSIKDNFKVLGYAGTAAQNFAYENNLQFVDLTLRFLKNLGGQTSILIGDGFETTISIFGLDAFCTDADVVLRDGQQNKVAGQISIRQIDSAPNDELGQLQEFEKTFQISVSNPSESCFLEVWVGDAFHLDNKLCSNAMKIDVLSASQNDVATLEFSGKLNGEVFDGFVVKLNDQQVENGSILLKNETYNFEFVANDGFLIESVSVNGVLHTNTNGGESFAISGQEVSSNSVNIVVNIKEMQKLEVSFATENGQVLIDEQPVEETLQVNRNQSLKFVVAPEKGYEVAYVEVDGKRLLPVANWQQEQQENSAQKQFVLEKITTNCNVKIVCEPGEYKLSIIIGKGGTVSALGTNVDSTISYEETRVFEISTFEGFAVDYVLVNGQKVDVTENKFELKNVDKDCQVMIVFRKIDNSVFENRVLMNYLIVFACLIVLFLIAKIVLMIVRKIQKQKEGMDNPTLHNS